MSLRQTWSQLSRPHWVLLILLGATSFFEGYDRGIVTIALPQIRNTFGLTQSQASLWLAVLFLGAIPALVLTRWADRVGRRRVLLIAVAGYTIASALTALAPSIGSYVALQFVVRFFLTVGSAVAWVLAAEELPAWARGFGFGWLAMNSAVGTGIGAIFYGGVLHPLGLSWRWMYGAGLTPLILLGALRRHLPESKRFVATSEAGQLASHWYAILRAPFVRWLALVTVTAVLLELTTQGSLFALDFLQTGRHHLSATSANFLLVAGGLPGIPVMVWAGSLSDRYGRRLIGCSFAFASLLGGLVFWWAPGGIPVLLPALTLVLVGSLGSIPALSAFSTELFPTQLRGQAGSWVAVAKVVGDAASLGLGSLLLRATGGLSPTVTVLGAGPLLAILIIARYFPDTHGRELEDVIGATPLHRVRAHRVVMRLPRSLERRGIATHTRPAPAGE